MTPDEIDAADKLSKELMAKQPTPAVTEAPPPPPENPVSSAPAATEAPPPEKPASSP
jgi:hypothetical protein